MWWCTPPFRPVYLNAWLQPNRSSRTLITVMSVAYVGAWCSPSSCQRRREVRRHVFACRFGIVTCSRRTYVTYSVPSTISREMMVNRMLSCCVFPLIFSLCISEQDYAQNGSVTSPCVHEHFVNSASPANI